MIYDIKDIYNILINDRHNQSIICKSKNNIIIPQSKIWYQTEVPITCHMYSNEVV